MDISKQLHAYEVEYHVLQDELQESSYACEDSEPLEKLEKANSQLKRQNMDLLEKLQVRKGRAASCLHRARRGVMVGSVCVCVCVSTAGKSLQCQTAQVLQGLKMNFQMQMSLGRENEHSEKTGS